MTTSSRLGLCLLLLPWAAVPAWAEPPPTGRPRRKQGRRGAGRPAGPAPRGPLGRRQGQAGRRGRRRRVHAPALPRPGRDHPAGVRGPRLPGRHGRGQAPAADRPPARRPRLRHPLHERLAGDLAAGRRRRRGQPRPAGQLRGVAARPARARTPATTGWSGRSSPARPVANGRGATFGTVAIGGPTAARRRFAGRVLPRQREQAGEAGRQHVAAVPAACGWSAPSATITPSRNGRGSSSGSTPPSSPATAGRQHVHCHPEHSARPSRPASPTARSRASRTAPGRSRRLAEWATTADNKYFARAGGQPRLGATSSAPAWPSRSTTCCAKAARTRCSTNWPASSPTISSI